MESDLPTVRKDATLDGETLVALTRFTSADDVRDVVRILQNRIVQGDLRTSMQKIASEAAINVSDHALSDHGYAVAQIYPRSTRLQLAIADCGVGVLRTLAKRGARTDLEALKMAIAGHSERDSGGGEGEGLPTLVRELKKSRSRGEMVSGRAKVNLGPGKSWCIPSGSFQGTLISVDIPALLDSGGRVVPPAGG